MSHKNITSRAKRVRAKLRAVSQYPRLSVFRSNEHIWAQVIDDSQGITLTSFNDKALKIGTKTEKAKKVGQKIAELTLASGVKQVVFDRGGYRFHGRVKALAEAARSAGLKI